VWKKEEETFFHTGSDTAPHGPVRRGAAERMENSSVKVATAAPYTVTLRAGSGVKEPTDERRSHVTFDENRKR